MLKGKTVAVVLLIVFLLITSLSACTPAQRPGPTVPNPNVQTPQNNQTNKTAASPNIIAQRVDQDINEINSATVVISGNQAWVGVDAYANMQVTSQVKDRISALVKELDPGIQTVYVTADADTVTRLKNMAQDVASGKPVSGFINELTEIARRITPTPR